MLTIPYENYTPFLPSGVSYSKGQLEKGVGGFLHWQILVALAKKGSLQTIRRIFGPFHAELSRSERAGEYVWKEDTRVDGTQFELGSKPVRLNSATDWDQVWTAAVAGDYSTIPSGVRIRNYFSLRAISAAHSVCVPMERQVHVFWGKTGTGKSKLAWETATMEAYPKDPRTKFWCGYSAQKNVIVDEFRGGIDVSHILRWTDRYPCSVEIKGSSVPLRAENIWFTSNLHPRDWYPDLDADTVEALLRRLQITQFH